MGERGFMRWQIARGCALTSCFALLVGCASIGPTTLPRDRFDYSSAMSESWKYQTLLNAIKLRYMDPPSFVDVAQVVSGYQLQTSVSAGGSASVNPASVPTLGSFLTFGAQGTYTDRPTITYVPLTGDQYLRGLMTPIRPEEIFSAILSGWPADAILFTAAVSMNGLKNQRFGGMYQEGMDPAFLRVLELARSLQASGAVGFRLQEEKEGRTKSILFFRTGNVTEEQLRNIREMRALLQLNQDGQEFYLVFGPTASSDRELAIQTRSLLQIMSEVGAQADVPQADVDEGRATPGFVERRGDQLTRRFIRILSSQEKSEHAYFSIRYRDRWFWIDDRDMQSKRSFAFLMLLFSMADTGERKSLPLITIPAQ